LWKNLWDQWGPEKIGARNHRSGSMTIKLDEIPQKIGVYLFHDKIGEIIYIGKANNLRRRVSQYFNSSRKRMENRIQQMIFNVADVKWIVEESELHALLLEDRLIKRHWPFYNARQKKFLRNRYLIFTRDKYPRLKILKLQEKEIGQTAYGPFPDEYFVADLLSIIYQFYPIRKCREPEPGKKCTNHQMTNCLAPCRGKITKNKYKKVVDKVTAFLRGDCNTVILSLDDQIRNAVQKLDFERAATLRDQILFCRRFLERQDFYNKFRTKDLLIREEGTTGNLYLFRRGDLIKSFKGNLAGDEFINTHKVSAPDARSTKREPDSYFLDKANVVYSWLRNTRTKKIYEFI
jgi:excinuclease ABC subunit C